jgi:uncharacterized protein YhbP (UPF0306 family)
MAVLNEPRILKFIGRHHILTLAVVNGTIPWCATCFYVYLPEVNLFVFTSDDETRHIRDVLESGNYVVSGTVALETRIVGKIQGIQFEGRIRRLEGEEESMAEKAYVRRFPVARLMPALHLWGVEPVYIKMTDNQLGFGKKLIWDIRTI